MKLTTKQLRLIIKEELDKFDPNISNEQFNKVKDLLNYDFSMGLMFLQSGLEFDDVSEEQREQLAKMIWDKSVSYKDSPEYVRELERKKVSVHYGDFNGEQFHKKKLAAMDRKHQDDIEAVGEMMGLENPYSDMLSISSRGRFAFEYFYDQLKKKGIL